jgi:hypothetical protein
MRAILRNTITRIPIIFTLHITTTTLNHTRQIFGVDVILLGNVPYTPNLGVGGDRMKGIGEGVIAVLRWLERH